MKRSIDELTLYMDRDLSRTTDKEEWIFEVEFPLENKERNLFLTVDERGKILSLTRQIPDETKPSRFKTIYHSSEGIDVFKQDVKEIYGFDINDLVESLSDNLDVLVNDFNEEDVANGIKVCKYDGKNGVFHDILIELQEEFKEKGAEENDLEK